MGNKILKEYDMNKEQVGSGGIGCYWRMYDGTGKKNREAVCIHIMDKGKLPKKIRTEAFYRWVRAEGATIARLKHPHILRVLHPLDESSDAFVLVTAPLLGSLANVMRDYTNLEKVPALLSDFSHRMTELDTKNGLRQLSEALLFMHRDAKLYHRYVDPCNIYITKDGDWKLGGFYYSVQVAAKGERVKNGELFDWTRNPDALLSLPSFKYLSPELADGAMADHDDNSDVFSLAKIAYHMNRFASRSEEKDRGAIPDLAAFQRHLRALPTMIYDGVPTSLVEPLKKMLSLVPQSRMDLREFLNSGYFNDVMVRTLQFLTSLLEKDIPQRIEFLKRLPSAIPLFDARTATSRILPPLLMQLRDGNLSPFALPSIMMIAKNMENKDYQSAVMSSLLPEFADGRPPPTVYVLLKNLNMLMAKSTVDVQNSHIVPFVLRSLESKQPQLVQLAITELVPCAREHLFTYRTLKEGVLPRVRAQCCAPPGQPLPLRVNALLGLSQLFQLFDTDTLNDVILPTIDTAVEIERAPAVIMCCVGVWDSISKVLGADVTARRILPKLLPITMEPSVNLQQFNNMMRIAKEMIDRLAKSRSEQLEKKAASGPKDVADVVGSVPSGEPPVEGAPNVATSSLQDMLRREYGNGVGDTPTTSTNRAPTATPIPHAAIAPAAATPFISSPAVAATPVSPLSPMSSSGMSGMATTDDSTSSMFAGMDYEIKDSNSMLSFIQAGDPYQAAPGAVIPVMEAKSTISPPSSQKRSSQSNVGDGYAAMSDDFMPRRPVMASASSASPNSMSSMSYGSNGSNMTSPPMSYGNNGNNGNTSNSISPTSYTRPIVAAASTPVISNINTSQPFDLMTGASHQPSSAAAGGSYAMPSYGNNNASAHVRAPSSNYGAVSPSSNYGVPSSSPSSYAVVTPMASSSDMGLFGSSSAQPPQPSSSSAGSNFDFLNNNGHVAGSGPPGGVGFDFMVATPAAAPSYGTPQQPQYGAPQGQYGQQSPQQSSSSPYGSQPSYGVPQSQPQYGNHMMHQSQPSYGTPASPAIGQAAGSGFDMFGGMNGAPATATQPSGFDFLGQPQSAAHAPPPAAGSSTASSGFSWM